MYSLIFFYFPANNKQVLLFRLFHHALFQFRNHRFALLTYFFLSVVKFIPQTAFLTFQFVHFPQFLLKRFGPFVELLRKREHRHLDRSDPCRETEHDPDVFLLRDENLKLKDKTKCAILTLNALFGDVLMTSDNVKTYGDRAKERLDDAFVLFRKAKNVTFLRKRNRISVRYEVEGTPHALVYDKEKGEFL